jgi:hypothetical protein
MPHTDRLPDRVRLGIDARHGSIAVTGHPDGVRRSRDRRRGTVERGLTTQRAAARIELGHRVASHRCEVRLPVRPEDRGAGGHRGEGPGGKQQAASARRCSPACRGGRRLALLAVGSGGGRRSDPGIVLEDGLVKRVELVAWLDPEVDERRPRVAVGLKGVRLATRAVQREHPLGVQTLTQRLLDHERVELTDHLGVATGGKVGVDRQLGRAQP